MTERFSAAVERVSHVAGVRGVLVVDAEAGVPVVSELREGVSETAVAALAASLFQRMASASSAADFGQLYTLQLEADDGHVVTVGAGEVVLVVIAERDAQIGLIRYEAHRAAETLR
jgi:predicted regulator of Ras-like GTPase activity (Roadblock/LC7/MglB family)